VGDVEGDAVKVKSWIKTIDKRCKEMAALRDKLDNDISEMETMKESCDRAWDDLQNARDALSELV
jgi:enoyl reductase-like protein